ncbi:MAG: hypothetical protein JXQ30_05345 [Spirochaetes bacterium]|nr:hypothetical protein [Spirochaetota bacterium]
MPRRCSVCIHGKRKEIEKGLLRGDSFRTIADRFECSISALKRHVSNGHLSQKLVKGKEDKDILRDDDLEREVQYWKNEIQGIYNEARSEDKKTALLAIDKAFKFIELQGRLIGKLEGSPRVNIFLNPQFIVLQQILVEELRDLPEVRARISERLQNAEGDSTNS